jgi:heat shock protein HslJ
MTGDPDAQNDLGQSDSPGTDKKRWLIATFAVVALILVGILAYAMLSTAGFFADPEPTNQVVFITITEPGQGARLDTTWQVEVKGQGGGLFEGNVVVQALDAAGNILAQEPTTIQSPEAGMGGTGPWSVNLNIDAEPGTQGQIVAFSNSPADGSLIAEDRVDVGFGESPAADELVKVEDHLWTLSELNGNPPIENTLITLQFENFQASGSGGCNNYRTSYERRRTDLNFGLVTSTAKECELPKGILNQEAAYFTSLEQVVAYRIENQQLNMIDGSGNLLLSFSAVVMGNVLGPGGTELPEAAVVYIHLSDVSLADADANPIAEQVITGASEFPIPYSVMYNPKEIVDNHTYAIGVRIEDDSGKLLFINPTAYHVITARNPNEVDVIVEAVQ